MSTLSHAALVAAMVQQLPAAAASVYTNPSSTPTYVKGWRLFNTSASVAELVKIYLVINSGGSLGAAAVANQVLEYLLQPKESLTEDFAGTGVVLSALNDSIQAMATDASTVNLVLFGDTAS